jgi:hypothetical protein
VRRAWILFFTLPGAAALGWWLRGADAAPHGAFPAPDAEPGTWTLAVATASAMTCLIVRPLDADRDRCAREARGLCARLGLRPQHPAGDGFAPGRASHRLDGSGPEAQPGPRSFLTLHVFCFAGAQPWDPGLAGCVLAGVRRDGRPFLAEPIVRLPREPTSAAAEVVRTALSGGDAPVEPGTSRTFLFAAKEEIDLAGVEALELRRGASVDTFVMKEQPVAEWEAFLGDPVPAGPGMPAVANMPERR